MLLDRDAIAAGNAGRGVDFVNLYGTWRDGVLSDDELAEVQVLLGTCFVESLAGYRFNRVLEEAVGRTRIELARATGTYRVVAEFPEGHRADADTRGPWSRRGRLSGSGAGSGRRFGASCSPTPAGLI